MHEHPLSRGFEPEVAVHFSVAVFRTTFSFSIVQGYKIVNSGERGEKPSRRKREMTKDHGNGLRLALEDL